jgi:hypothetical protein
LKRDEKKKGDYLLSESKEVRDEKSPRLRRGSNKKRRYLKMRRLRNIRLTVPTLMIFALALLFPVISIAGSLEPTDPPGPTMRTLDEIYTRPIWDMFDKTFVDWPDNPRFAVCDNGTTDDTFDDMVLDKETGLVWQRDLAYNSPALYLITAIDQCGTHIVAGRKGWRLPTEQELFSLVDPTRYNPALPSGHPFLHVQMDGFYWTSTASSSMGYVIMVEFYTGLRAWSTKNEAFRYYWCVRGGKSDDASLLLWIQ